MMGGSKRTVIDWNSLAFLAEPAFVIVWYGFGLIAAAWTLYDSLMVNTNVQPPLKAAWPIIITFFSVVGLILYLATCRPPGIANKRGEEAKKVHHKFVSEKWKRVVGSVIHCVGGDGLGIMTAMVITRLIGVDFWTEFWIEYAVGFAFGWFIFQYWAMRNIGELPIAGPVEGRARGVLLHGHSDAGNGAGYALRHTGSGRCGSSAHDSSLLGIRSPWPHGGSGLYLSYELVAGFHWMEARNGLTGPPR